MKTSLLLMAQFEKPVVPLEQICKEYFSCSRHTAFIKAKAGTLPIPAFRCGSNKGTWMVHISDLAVMIDSQREQARKDWVGAN